MKSLITVIFSFIIFGASFQNSLFMIDYKINQDFYEIHCINKAKPELSCHGKCQMKKESDKSTNPFNLVKYAFEFNILPTAPVDFFIKKQNSAPSRSADFSYQELFIPEILLSIPPHPPQV
ncbi:MULTISPECIES: hypothetical protein [Chryseobacterium]|uniref:Uncharacterized protein n=1 Tax=Chryseobacterium salivictor TaxID=2547600 RepID=A0A4P6ZEB3_9FLAO|nr:MULTISPECIES: hypothetical protein [Chryseobacterium]MDQ0476725.1 hypothetical protein [Chryseobacterium sp. MDT2-18]QBO57888.1 hypothetical protein NBC122_01059 [Chryseobacterium salivictor]